VTKLDTAELDNPVWAALTGPHAAFARRHGSAARYLAEVSPFAAVGDPTDERSWANLAALIGPGGRTLLTGPVVEPPAGWEVLGGESGVQLLDAGVAAADDPEAVELGLPDVPEMLDLVERTRPGPFLARTVQLGGYRGIRRDGALIAMAGERMRTPGYTEISAVCTDEAFRGQGLARRLVLAVAAGIRRRGQTPIIHAAASNVAAVRLYEAMGFRVRYRPVFAMVQAPTS
jgi:ribosomal protein S18 acetylase RimI-like enzyme